MMAMYAEIAEKFQNLNFTRLFLRNGFIQHKEEWVYPTQDSLPLPSGHMPARTTLPTAAAATDV